MSENIRNFCRLCLDVSSDHVPIFGDPAIHLQIKSCLAVTISSTDSLPKSICSSCVCKLSEFYDFQLNARCSQDWLESSMEEQVKKPTESKLPVQPLPDSEYNSDSLLEFLNNTANIEEYLNNLGKEDIPCIVNMLDENQENSLDGHKGHLKVIKQSPKKKENAKMKSCLQMEIDVLDSDIEIVKELLMKETEPKKQNHVKDKNHFTCFGCKSRFDNLQKLSQHLSICDIALRTCSHCNLLFDSKYKMHQHYITHNNSSTCHCGKNFATKAKLGQHIKSCVVDLSTSMGCVYRCKQCKETFKERYQLYKHAKEHVKKENMRICDLCGHSFIDDDALVKHRKEAHNGVKSQLYRCKVCLHTSADHNEIYQHIQKYCLQVKKQPDRHLCESCGKSFTTKASLHHHIQQHTTECCNICSKTFKDAKSRDEHILEHKEATICEKCGQSICSSKLDGHSCL